MICHKICTFVLLIVILLASCAAPKPSTSTPNHQSITEFKFEVTPASEWSALFKRTHGWLGGDGIFMLTLNGDERIGASAKNNTMIWFSDTQLGDIVDNKLLSDDTLVINNSVAILRDNLPDSNAIQFYWNTLDDSTPTAIFKPSSKLSKPHEYYWLGDAFVNASKQHHIYLFGYRVQNVVGKPGFSFSLTGNTLIRIPNGNPPHFQQQQQFDIPFYKESEFDSIGIWGSAILVNTKEARAKNADGYVYIYRVGGGNVFVSRVLPQNIERFDTWEFWDGKKWMKDPYLGAPLASRASNEMSVTALADGRYLMVFQIDGVGNKIGARLGTSPVGPFGPIIELYDASYELSISPNAYVYNAKAHPVISTPGELLISYNINSTDYFNDIKKMPNFYRPRFIKLKYEMGK